jgi:hypothetical protein
MNVDKNLVNRIVRDVVAQLRRADQPVQESLKGDSTTGKNNTTSNGIRFDGNVITADLLERKVNGEQEIVIGTKSLLTPSARDFLRDRNITWTRDNNEQSRQQNKTRWLAVTVNVTPATRSAMNEFMKNGGVECRQEICGSTEEAITTAVSAICRADADGVVMITNNADEVACKTNRQRKVRGIVARDTRQVDMAQEQIGANLFCVDPKGKSFIELRNILREITSAGAPKLPEGWNESL